MCPVWQLDIYQDWSQYGKLVYDPIRICIRWYTSGCCLGDTSGFVIYVVVYLFHFDDNFIYKYRIETAIMCPIWQPDIYQDWSQRGWLWNESLISIRNEVSGWLLWRRNTYILNLILIITKSWKKRANDIKLISTKTETFEQCWSSWFIWIINLWQDRFYNTGHCQRSV
jgi:hypothetical protein